MNIGPIAFAFGSNLILQICICISSYYLYQYGINEGLDKMLCIDVINLI